MEIIFSPEALIHRDEWRKSGNRKLQSKIQELLNSIQISPFQGIVKPEHLTSSGR